MPQRLSNQPWRWVCARAGGTLARWRENKREKEKAEGVGMRGRGNRKHCRTRNPDLSGANTFGSCRVLDEAQVGLGKLLTCVKSPGRSSASNSAQLLGDTDDAQGRGGGTAASHVGQTGWASTGFWWPCSIKHI